jgi:hypothetical protein
LLGSIKPKVRPEIGKGLHTWAFAHARTRTTTSGRSTGSDMIVKFNPEGHVTMCSAERKGVGQRSRAVGTQPDPPLPPVIGRSAD